MEGPLGYFRLERGTRQGDLLSAYLFVLALEVLLIQIRQNNDIKGVIINNADIKLSAYADDTYFLASDVISLHNIPAVFILEIKFRQISCLLDRSS